MEQKISISTYAEYSRSGDIHGTSLYPGVMVAPVQRDIMREHLSPEGSAVILDPFVGSGTSLYEARQINSDVLLIGSDINPLAILITRVKLEGIDNSTFESDLAAIRSKLLNEDINVESLGFHNRDKWFKSDVAKSLTRVRDAILAVQNDQNRRFFWYMMIDIVRKYCNSRSSTYKLHKRPQEQIDKIEDGVIEDYLKKTSSENGMFRDGSAERLQLNQGDSLGFMKGLNDSSVDICITSPPYGDNATTIPYGQYSNLAMAWIDAKDLCLDGWELETYAAIDSRSLGGPRSAASGDSSIEITDTKVLEQIGHICSRKQGKVRRFIRGYQESLDEIARVTKGTIILTLGNRTVDGVTLDLVGFTKRHLASKGLEVEERTRRTIEHKRTPASVSRVDGKPVASMGEEVVLVAAHSEKMPPKQTLC